MPNINIKLLKCVHFHPQISQISGSVVEKTSNHQFRLKDSETINVHFTLYICPNLKSWLILESSKQTASRHTVRNGLGGSVEEKPAK